MKECKVSPSVVRVISLPVAMREPEVVCGKESELDFWFFFNYQYSRIIQI